MGKNWEFFINLSGQDLPLKTQTYIMEYLSRNRGKEFIKVLDHQKECPDTMTRIHDYIVETRNSIYRTSHNRAFLYGVIPYIGNQWMIVNRDFCEFVCRSPKAAPYKTLYRYTFIADEGFFQTVIMNNAIHGEIVSDDLRMMDWIPDGNIKLRPRTYTGKDAAELIASQNLFARKFDIGVDAEMFDLMERHL